MAVTTALIGCGPRGTEWIGPALASSDKFSLVAVCDTDTPRMLAAAAKLGVPAEGDLGRLLSDRALQSVIITTGTRSHVPVALQAVAAGKHIYVEKPLADTSRAALLLANAAQKANVVAVVGYQFRATPFAMALSVELPAIHTVQALLTAHRLPLMQQFFIPDHYGGIMDDTTHVIHLALWAMGGKPDGVMAHVRRGTVAADRTIDCVTLLVDFDQRSRAAAIQSSMFGARQATNIIQFVGTHGIITSTDWQTLRVSRHAGVHEPGPKAPEGLTVLTLETPKTGYQRDTTALLEHFADLISGAADPTRPHACTLEQGAAVIAVMEAMVRSHEEGRRIALTEVL